MNALGRWQWTLTAMSTERRAATTRTAHKLGLSSRNGKQIEEQTQ